VTVNNGATIKGSGTAAGIVVGTGGLTAPGNSIGTLNVAGNVSFTPGSLYQVEADATGAADRITATGLASLTGGTVQVLAAPGNYDAGLTYTILSATGGVTGTFSNVTVDLATIDPTVTYTPTAVLLTLKTKVLAVFPTISGTPNQIAAGTAIQAGGAGSALYKALLNFTPAAARAAFDAASGEIHATLLASQMEAASATRRVVLERMRAGGTNDTGWSVWGSITGNWGDVDSDGNAASARRTGVSLTAGADTRLDDNWRGGFEGGYSSNKLRVDVRNSAADIQSGHVGAYAYGAYDAIKLRAGGSYGFGTADTQRVVTFTGFNELATASQDADTLNLFGEAGYTFSFEGYAIEPFAGLSWSQVKAGSFRESGGSAALAGTSRTFSDGFVTLGAQASATPFAFAGVSLAPTVRAGWQHAFRNDLASRSLSFISTGQGFTVLGTPLDADRAVLDAGATLSLGDSVNLFLGYSGTLSSRASDSSLRITGSISL
jgi:outer membrane autotransporter protein